VNLVGARSSLRPSGAMGRCASVRSWPCSSGDGDGRSDRIVQLRLREDFSDNMGPIVRVQPFGAAIDSHYLRWAEPDQRADLHRIDANGTSYTASPYLASRLSRTEKRSISPRAGR